MILLYITFLLLYINKVNNINLNNEIRMLLHGSHKEDDRANVARKAFKDGLILQHDAADATKARDKANILKNARGNKYLDDTGHDKQIYQRDPILNQVRRSGNHRSQSDSSSLSSSSLELPDWKDQFNEQWVQKKFEAVNSTDTRGDVVNMLAARPSGVSCGDDELYDVPWGSCVLPMECDAEYRIYRGDHYCGNTRYVCCSLVISAYDMNQGFDISFDDTSLETDSDEREHRERNSKENKRKKRRKDRRKRRKDRRKRKRQIKRKIRKIIHEMRKILHRSFRNSTNQRKKRTKLLKKYVKDLKKQYMKDRIAVRDIHLEDMIRIDDTLMAKLDTIKKYNKEFMENTTFREIVTKGQMTRAGARMLVEAYPQLKNDLEDKLRRSGGGLVNPENVDKIGDHLQYDVEY